jgi:hypothetical protein
MRDGFRFFRWSAAAALALAATVCAARPVARWDIVPDQVFTGVFLAGVCAFHAAGVQVEFRVGGSLVHTAANPAFVDRCHFVDPAKTMGTTRTTGDAGFRNAAARTRRRAARAI